MTHAYPDFLTLSYYCKDDAIGVGSRFDEAPSITLDMTFPACATRGKRINGSNTMESILTASRSYESWLLNHLGIAGEPEALALKHELVKEGEFPFLRATFYRWVQRWETEAGDLATPATPACSLLATYMWRIASSEKYRLSRRR